MWDKDQALCKIGATPLGKGPEVVLPTYTYM